LATMRSALKTGLFPIDPDAADELENYLVAHGTSGIDAWREVFRPAVGSSTDPGASVRAPSHAARLDRVDRSRETILHSLERWIEFAQPTVGHNGAEWSTAIIGLLESLGVGGRLAAWTESAEADGDLDQAEEHRQVRRDVVSFLDDLAYAFADLELAVEDLPAVLEAGLAQLTLGLAPPMLDQVLVGSIERSRHPEIKAVVILGFNDGVFPRPHREESILNDDDRRVMIESGLALRPPSRERMLEETMLLYIALTRASEALVLTYATADNAGKAMRISPFADAVAAACPDLRVRKMYDPDRARATWDIQTTFDVVRRLAGEFRSRGACRDDDPVVRGVWNELYDAFRVDIREHPALKMAVAGLGETPRATMTRDSARRLTERPFKASVSQLETYAACPFKHFATYGLRLREREEASLEAVDVGTLHHAILEDFANALSARSVSFGEIDDADLMRQLSESCSRVAAKQGAVAFSTAARDAYILRRSASQIERVVRTQKTLARGGRSRPWRAELSFGMGADDGLDPLEITSPAGRRVLLRGFIDRVDLAELADETLGIVIDYKRTPDKRLDMSMVYHGLSLQLIGYLLVLAKHGRTPAGRSIIPAGALYVSTSQRYQRTDHPDHTKERESALPGAYLPRGLIRSDKLAVLESADDLRGWSYHVAVFRNKNGGPGHVDKTDDAPPDVFEDVLAHTRMTLGRLADGIMDGMVNVEPYRLGTFSPCGWCPMSSVCRFETGLCDVRFLERLKRSEVFKRIAQSPSA
ncbi:MAG: PD-(D/E)XK nuclease family protein, partial [Planctomycetes bacterium]|nr:PD-(D/E)XK nuclease family protein [Planctomycetota bacterium]